MCFKKKQGDVLVKFEGANEDLVWTSPSIKGLYAGRKIDVVVPFTHEAICVKDGVADNVWQSGRYTLETDKRFLEQDIRFYFINKSTVVAVNWGTPSQIDVIDPVFEMPVKFGANGEIKLSVSDSKKFLYKVVGVSDGITANGVAGFFRNKIALLFNTHLAKHMSEYKISYFELAERLQAMSAFLKESLSGEFEAYGLQIDDFIINGIKISEDTLETFRKDAELVRRLKVRGETFEKLRQESRDAKESEAERQIRLIKALGECFAQGKDEYNLNVTNKSLL